MLNTGAFSSLVLKEVYIQWVNKSAGCFKILSFNDVFVQLQPLNKPPIYFPQCSFVGKEPFLSSLSSIMHIQELPKPKEETKDSDFDADMERLRKMLLAEAEEKRRMLERLDAIEQRLERLERQLLK